MLVFQLTGGINKHIYAKSTQQSLWLIVNTWLLVMVYYEQGFLLPDFVVYENLVLAVHVLSPENV